MHVKLRKSGGAKGTARHNGQMAAQLERARQDWSQGVALGQAGKWPQAVLAFGRASQACPQDTVFMLNLAHAHMKCAALSEASVLAQRVLDAEPDNALARDILTKCLREQNQHGQAAAVMLQTPEQAPRGAAFYQELGESLFNAGEYQQAIGVLFDALGRDITHALSHYRLGLSFNALGMKKEATECFRTALALGMGPGDLAAQGLVAFIERELCRWEHADDDVMALRQLAQGLAPNADAWASVFAQVTLTDEPQEHLAIARSCARYQARGVQPMPTVTPRSLGSRLRVGFVSSDLHQHATSILMVEVFEQLSRERFEVTLYSHGPDDGSAMRERVKRSADHFVEVSKLSDQAVATQIRRDGIEVLVDLKGHTRDSRLGIFAHRPAPVQISFLGFPGTTGADYMDYFVGDGIASPLSHADDYSEKLALMPRCYQPNDRQRHRPEPVTRTQAGLPESALVLCGFNQPFKLSPEVFDVWCRLLQQVPDAVLWLLEWHSDVPAALRAQAAARGVDPARLVFAPRVGTRQHLDRFALADVFLDSWPCNGHTTVSDALWAGVPVVTHAGRSFASRVASSLLHAVGQPQCSTDSVAAYEAKVLELAQDPAKRQALRQHLLASRDTAPLFDSQAYTRDFGDLLWATAQRWSQGLPPDHIQLTQGSAA